MRARAFWAVTEPLVGIGVGLFICWHVAKGAVGSITKGIK